MRTAKAIVLIRLLVGWVFLSEGVQKFLFPDTLGVGRFVKIGIPWPQVMAPFVGTVEILCGTLDLFPGVRTTADRLRVGAWRDDSHGPMQVVSGPIGRHKIHYEAPAAGRLANDMEEFLKWPDGNAHEDPLLKAAIAHLWFVTIHPFEDGNGRIGRAITEMCLARSDGSAQRFYSMSAQILEERKNYYEVLEKTQSGSLDITEWLVWFLECLDRAIERSNRISASAIEKELFWKDLKKRSSLSTTGRGWL